MKNDNNEILARLRGVPMTRGSPETDADPGNPNTTRGTRSADVSDVLNEMADRIGALCGAAKHDLNIADPADVGFNGMSILGWRRAYFEGCTDMANTALNSIPNEQQRDAFQARAKTSFTHSFDEAAKAHETPLISNPD